MEWRDAPINHGFMDMAQQSHFCDGRCRRRAFWPPSNATGLNAQVAHGVPRKKPHSNSPRLTCLNSRATRSMPRRGSGMMGSLIPAIRAKSSINRCMPRCTHRLKIQNSASLGCRRGKYLCRYLKNSNRQSWGNCLSDCTHGAGNGCSNCGCLFGCRCQCLARGLRG